MSLFDDVYRVLADEEAVNRRLKRGKRPMKGIGSFYQDLWTTFQPILDSIPRTIESADGLCFSLDVSDGTRLQDLAVRKSLIFGDKTVLYAGDIIRYELGGAIEYEYWIPPRLIRLLLQYKDLIQAGVIIPVPGTLRTRKSPQTIEELHSPEAQHVPGPASLGRWRKSLYADRVESLPINAALSNERLLMQLSEGEGLANAVHTSSGRLLLPSVKGWNTHSLLRLRHDENEAFLRFHRRLKRLLRDSKPVTDGDVALLTLMQETDYEVRELDAKIRAHRNDAQLTLELGVVALGVAFVSVITPAEIAGDVRAMLGSAGLLGLTNLLIESRAKERDFKREDFYFAWKIGFERPS